MIRSKGEAGTGNIVEAVRHLRTITGEIRRLSVMGDEELMSRARDLGAPYELVRTVSKEEKLPVVMFCAGGVATPADAALVMQLGAEGVFVGSGVFKSDSPARTAAAIVKATTNYQDPAIIAEVSKGLGEPMRGIDVRTIPEQELMAPRGW
jgi:pyridoxal 5'-phosphate synthase pdxS subunit